MVEKNGIEYLIKAINLLNQNVKLLIIGDGPLKNKLKKLVKELNLENDVQFLGKIPYEKIQNYYAQADVFCRPSLSEGFGNVFIQAMAAEVPIIATPIGGIVDFLLEGKTGYICYPEDSDHIFYQLEHILNKKNKESVDHMVKDAKKMVEEKYTWQIVSQQMKEIFNSLC